MSLVYSFDVFDTCVTRRHAHPRDLFFELGLRLASREHDTKSAHRFAKKFQARRIQAEKRAHRRARPNECVTIHQIYECLNPPAGLCVDRGSLIAAELALEEESIYAVPTTTARLTELRQLGHRIIFISDMYIPGDVLGKMLVSKGVMRPGEALYVSCDHGVTKHSGNLYRRVLESEGITAEALVHTGDNFWADVKSAREVGVAASHFPDASLSKQELRIAGRRISKSPSSSFLSALSRRTRLMACNGAQSKPVPDPLDEVIHSVIAPFLVGFVDWIVEEAKREGYERLYFVARDGDVLYRIANSLCEGRGPEFRYLYGSRRAWLAPNAGANPKNWLRLMIVPGQTNSRKDILERVGLSSEDQQQISAELAIDPSAWEARLTQVDAEAFVSSILSSRAADTILQSSSRAYQSVASSYLEQEGLLEGVRWALVDAGWSLNSQAALRGILQACGAKVEPHGYYIGLTRDHLVPSVAGQATAFVTPAGNLFSRRRVIIEHCFTPSLHRTTVGYRDKNGYIEPEFGEELRTPAELAYAERVHTVSDALAKLLAEDTSARTELRRHRPEVIANAARLLRRPDRAVADAMSIFGTVADVRHHRSLVQPLCRPLTLTDLWSVVGMSLSPKLNFSTPSFMWLEGSNALSPWYIRGPISLMLLVDHMLQRRTKRR